MAQMSAGRHSFWGGGLTAGAATAQLALALDDGSFPNAGRIDRREATALPMHKEMAILHFKVVRLLVPDALVSRRLNHYRCH